MNRAQEHEESLRNRSGGLARWSIQHPIGVTAIATALIVLGLFSLWRLPVDLLPHIIYPDVRIRVLDPGVPATVMEDRVTRQLEEQLAITEDAIRVQSFTSEGVSRVDLSFEYGKDIDVALRDASTRLDRARRFLPDSIEPPIIYKRDPAQIPVAEYVVGSALRDPVELRAWVDYVFAKWFLNLPGVASTEVGGGLVREILVLPDQQRLAALGLSLADVESALKHGNVDSPAGRLLTTGREISGRTAGRFRSVAEIADLPLAVGSGNASTVRLGEVAEVIDGHGEERLRVRVNGIPGIKLSVQKQPHANTVAVVDAVKERMAWLRAQGLIPDDIQIHIVADQSVYVRNALRNATEAAGFGALLAMLVVYLFLGDLRRTLLIGSAIPIAVMVTFALMYAGGLTLNIMTLGGLALGIGMLVDSTIVMLENIQRRQRQGNGDAARIAATEVTSAIVASTSTNLAAVLPFLFITGLAGLLFRELIITISSAIAASMLVALTLVPALGARIPNHAGGLLHRGVDRVMEVLKRGYGGLVGLLLKAPWMAPLVFAAALAWVLPPFLHGKQLFLPNMDEGRVSVSVTADPGITLDEMDAAVQVIEDILQSQPEVQTVFTTVGGFIFGRTERKTSNRTGIYVQLVPRSQRSVSAGEWIRRVQKQIAGKKLAGIKVRIRSRGIRGVRLSHGDDDISVRIQGPRLEQLERLADGVVERLRDIQGLRNLEHSLEESRQELAVRVDRERAADLGLNVEDIGTALRMALEGRVVTDYLDGDRAFDVRLRLPRMDVGDPQALEDILLRGKDGQPVRLGEVADIGLIPAPATIARDNQRRMVEISASLTGDATLGQVNEEVWKRLRDFPLPDGYHLYDGGAGNTLEEGRQLTRVLLALALFLVFVVMAVQYESLRNPVVIMLSVPFAVIGVILVLERIGMPVSMPVWLGLIMLAGIVVNNAIVLVEFIELQRKAGLELVAAIREAARLRLRPILMTTLTTVTGMLPLALGLGDGAEMLQPLAVTIVAGLSFSTLVSLVLVPCVYRILASGTNPAKPG